MIHSNNLITEVIHSIQYKISHAWSLKESPQYKITGRMAMVILFRHLLTLNYGKEITVGRKPAAFQAVDVRVEGNRGEEPPPVPSPPMNYVRN